MFVKTFKSQKWRLQPVSLVQLNVQNQKKNVDIIAWKMTLITY